MIALLGLLAVAGYQNRDKIAEMLGARKQEAGGAPGQASRRPIKAAYSVIWEASSAVRAREAY
jgi:hypothetical protein